MLLKDLGATWPGTPPTTARPSCATPTCAGRPTATWPGSSAPPGSSSSAGPTCPSSARTVTTEPVAYGPDAQPVGPRRTPPAARAAARRRPSPRASCRSPTPTTAAGRSASRASECGLVGLKPTRGRVSHGPDIGEGWAGATIDGVVTRSVRDAAAVLDAIAGPMPGDPYIAPPLARPLAEEVGRALGRLRVGLLDADPGEQYLDHPDVPGRGRARRPAARGARLHGRARDAGRHVRPGVPAALHDHDRRGHLAHDLPPSRLRSGRPVARRGAGAAQRDVPRGRAADDRAGLPRGPVRARRVGPPDGGVVGTRGAGGHGFDLLVTADRRARRRRSWAGSPGAVRRRRAAGSTASSRTPPSST